MRVRVATRARERLAMLGLASLSLCEGSASQQHWVPVAIAIIERRRLYACEARSHILQSDTRRVRKGAAGCGVTELGRAGAWLVAMGEHDVGGSVVHARPLAEKPPCARA